MIVIAALGVSAAVAPTLALATPAVAPHGKPTIASVQRQLGQLAVTNGQLVEKFNQARIKVDNRTRAAAKARAAAARATRAYNRANVTFTRTVQAQYESGGIGMGGVLLDSNSGNNYINRLDTMNLLSSHDADVVTAVTRSHAIATQKAALARTMLAQATKERDALGQKRDSVSKQIAKYRKLLATLNSAQQAAYIRANSHSVTPSTIQHTIKHFTVTPTSAAAHTAVEFALAQVGKPYVWGSGGPSSYDCSGLTMASWAAAGVSLPHSSRDQYNYGTHVSRDQLQPGDLIFFYQPISHVTIYIGNGLMVSAPTSGQDVTVVPLDAFNSDYAGATHIG
jgi:cell wall-associated NlpC family hydrolase